VAVAVLAANWRSSLLVVLFKPYPPEGLPLGPLPIGKLHKFGAAGEVINISYCVIFIDILDHIVRSSVEE